MDRSFLHLTVAAVVCAGDKFLFVEEIDKISGRRVLNQPAGHVEANEDLLGAVRRELWEESGLHLEPDAWLGISQLNASNGHRYTRVNFCYQLATQPAKHLPQDPDILALHWLTPAELNSHPLPVRSQLVTDAIALFLQGVRLDLALIKSPVDSVSVAKKVL
jgi:phosphatase NudJ